MKQEQDEPPLHKDPLFLFTIVFILIVLGLSAWNVFRPREPVNYNPVIREQSVVRQIIPHSFTRKMVLASLMDRIIHCESGFDPTAKNPKSTAYGLCQFLDGTWKYVQEKWQMKLDRDDPDDQLYACQRLLEEEGLSHWKSVWKCIGYNH